MTHQHIVGLDQLDHRCARTVARIDIGVQPLRQPAELGPNLVSGGVAGQAQHKPRRGRRTVDRERRSAEVSRLENGAK